MELTLLNANGSVTFKDGADGLVAPVIDGDDGSVAVVDVANGSVAFVL